MFATVLIHGIDGASRRHADEHANWKRHGRPTPLRELTGEEPNQDQNRGRFFGENCATSKARSSTTFRRKSQSTQKLDSTAQHSQLLRAPDPTMDTDMWGVSDPAEGPGTALRCGGGVLTPHPCSDTRAGALSGRHNAPPVLAPTSDTKVRPFKQLRRQRG